MNIAIADDLEKDRQAVTAQLQQYINQSYPEIVKDVIFDEFSCAEDLLSNFYPGKYDLLILDIFMVDMTGMEAAEVIRRPDERVPIVFLTTSQDYLMEGYRVFATGYLLKPLEEHLEEFFSTTEHIFSELISENRCITAVINGNEVNIPLKKIVYVDINDRHKLSLHLLHMEVEMDDSYTSFQELLAETENFIECHHRISVNMDYIKRMDTDDFIMKEGSRVPISRRRQKEVKATYMRYLVHR